MLRKLKTDQCCKLRELQAALWDAGFHTIEEQSRALGVCRSTGWTIVKAIHKGSGLSATIIKRMLAAPQLPLAARAKILEYIEEKADGQYGHSPTQRRKFIARLAAQLPPGGNTIFRHCRREAEHQEQQTKSPSLQPAMIAKQRKRSSL